MKKGEVVASGTTAFWVLARGERGEKMVGEGPSGRYPSPSDVAVSRGKGGAAGGGRAGISGEEDDDEAEKSVIGGPPPPDSAKGKAEALENGEPSSNQCVHLDFPIVRKRPLLNVAIFATAATSNVVA